MVSPYYIEGWRPFCFCKQTPSGIAANLIMSGYDVYEALAVSEVLFICEHHKIDAVVIAADVEDPDIIETRLQHVTFK
jgi:hypothetical protein